MKNSTQYYDEQRLRELAKDPKNRVLVPKYDMEFDPWPATRVATCVTELSKIAHDPANKKDATKIRTKAMLNDELVSFAQHHNSMYDKLTDPVYFEDERFIKGITTLVGLRSQVELGVLAEGKDADTAATAAMLKVSMNLES